MSKSNGRINHSNNNIPIVSATGSSQTGQGGIPNRIGSLNFCPICGNLLDIPGNDDTITCNQCGHIEDAIHAFPSPLKDRRSVVKALSQRKDLQDQMSKGQEIDEKCPECGNPTMTYHTLQLRGADEGSTVFYECPQCGHKHNTNN